MPAAVITSAPWRFVLGYTFRLNAASPISKEPVDTMFANKILLVLTLFSASVAPGQAPAEENIDRVVNVDGMAKLLGVSPSHMNTVFKSYTAMTPHQYFISIKIRRAKELLETGNLPVKEIASRLGFDDQYYFSRLFHKKTGIAPSRWNAFVHQ